MCTKEYMKEWTRKTRREIISLLGGKCIECGISDWRALQIDHVNGGGGKERLKITGTRHASSGAYYRFILKKIKLGSKDYQLLCANCNQIKRYVKNEDIKAGD